MLFNIDSNLCVSKHSISDCNKWICYSSCNNVEIKRRPTWKCITGLLSTDGMYHWLLKYHNTNNAADKFSSLSYRERH